MTEVFLDSGNNTISLPSIGKESNITVTISPVVSLPTKFHEEEVDKFEPEPTWKKISKAKCKERDSKIPKEWLIDPVHSSILDVMDVPYSCGLMTAEELELTEKDATELISLLAGGEVKSYDLTLAFCKRASICQQVTNCLAEIFFEEGLKRAKELDDILTKTGKPVGPFHGLPFSIKDQFRVKGHDAAAGYVGQVGSIATEDSEVVAMIREAGAVFYCKTTNPQTLMHLETVSNIYGRTLNPFNRKLTPGGSSGGEGALVGFHGSPIGLGADGGGSIRAPAGCVGAYGLRSTSGRLSLIGMVLPNAGSDSTPVVTGPICSSARDNELFFKVMVGMKPWLRDPAVVPMPWRKVSEPSRIKIGYFKDDGVVNPHPPIHRAINSLIEKLSHDKRFTFVEWSPPSHAKGYDIIRRCYYMDGGAESYRIMASTGEPVLENSAWIMKPSHSQIRSVHEIWNINTERDEYRQKYLKYWNEKQSEVDVVLCPWSSGVAFRHNMSKYWGYTAIFNLLDYPSITFPTGLTVDPSIDTKDSSYKPRDNEFDDYIYNTYEPEEFRGAPICLQLVARPWMDEELFAALRMIESSLK